MKVCQYCNDTGQYEIYTGRCNPFLVYCDCRKGRDFRALVGTVNPPSIEEYKIRWIKSLSENAAIKRQLEQTEEKLKNCIAANEEQIRVHMIQKEKSRQKIKALQRVLNEALTAIEFLGPKIHKVLDK